MSMIKYIIRRALSLLPVLFGAVTFTFILSRLMPGDPVLAYCALAGRTCPADQYEAWLRYLGLDRPMIEQYFRYLGQLFTGNWGVSSAYRGIPVWEVVTTRFFRTSAPRQSFTETTPIKICSVPTQSKPSLRARFSADFKTACARGVHGNLFLWIALLIMPFALSINLRSLIFLPPGPG